MKKIFLLLFISFVFNFSFGQSEWYHFSEEFYFVKEVPVNIFHGKNFRFEIAVKGKPADSLSKVRIHGISLGKGEDDYLNSDFKVESRTEQDWTIYTIMGKVDPKAARLWFYSAVNGNGDFYFDDVNFYIEEAPRRWKQLLLFNPSFEEKNPDIFYGYFVSRRRSPNLKTQLSKEISKTGKQSLWVKTYRVQPVKQIAKSQ